MCRQLLVLGEVPHVLGELHERLQVRCGAAPSCLVQAAEVAAQDPAGPAIGDDVVHQEIDAPPIVRELRDRGPHQRALHQVVRHLDRLELELGGARLALGLGHVREVHEGHVQGQLVVNPLPLPVLGDRRAQRLMAVNKGLERGPHGDDIQCSAYRELDRQVECARPFIAELGADPDLLLVLRERDLEGFPGLPDRSSREEADVLQRRRRPP